MSQDGSQPQHADAECRICPLCQALALLRQVRPETVDQLATAMTELLGVVRDLVAGRLPDGPRAGPVGGERDVGQDAGSSGAAGSARHARVDRVVQWIDISD